MSNHRPSRLDRAAVEKMLGPDLGQPDGHPRLAAVLAAAAGPTRPGELADESVLVAAFHAGHAAATATRALQAQSRLRAAVRRVLTVKMAVAALVAAATAGTAVAAGTAGRPATAPSPRPTVATPAPSPTADAQLSRRTPTGPAPTVPPAVRQTPTTVPGRALPALCHAYFQGNKATRGKALDGPAFADLVEAAGGRDSVDDFCADLVDDNDGRAGTDDDDPGTGRGNGKGNGNGNGKGGDRDR